MTDKIALEQLEGITSDLSIRLNSLGINCAEDLIAYYMALKDNASILSDALKISDSAIHDIIKQAEQKLPEKVLKELADPLPLDEMKYGAHDPHLLNDE